MELKGVKAQVYIKYEGSVKDLTKKISKIMILPDFSFDTEPISPYREFSFCECLGFELWIENSTKICGYDFLFRLESQLSLEESFYNKIHDISLWLARYLSVVSEMEYVVIINSNLYTFKKGEYNKVDFSS